MASDSLHEPAEQLQPSTIEYHRAIVSLMEELEAIDWYNQRIDASRDEELRKILTFNRDEEKVHASMVLEWIRRHDPAFARPLGNFLQTEGSIVDLAEAAEHAESESEGASSGPSNDGSLGIGSLKGKP